MSAAIHPALARLRQDLLLASSKSHHILNLSAIFNSHSMASVEESMLGMGRGLEIHRMHSEVVTRLPSEAATLSFSIKACMGVAGDSISNRYVMPDVWPMVISEKMKIDPCCEKVIQTAAEIAETSPHQAHPDLNHSCSIYALLQVSEEELNRRAMTSMESELGS